MSWSANIRRSVLLLGSLTVLLLGSAVPTSAKSDYPSPAVCSDTRGVLGPQTCARVAEILTADELASTDEIAVAIIGTTGTSTIEGYATALFNSWGVGKAGVDNGVLVLVAFDDRAMRIEVGAGLSDRLPDGQAREIVGGVMVPAFKEGDYRDGVLAGLDAVRSALGHPVDASNQLTAIPADPGYEPARPKASALAIAPSYSYSRDSNDDDESDSTSNAGLWIAIAGIGVILALISWYRSSSGGGSDDGSDNDSYGASGGGYRRRSSYRSFSSRSSRSSGSSRRSGGFGGGRSSGGGASGKW
ncbi:MAG: TPM domain-containing protein [Nakamurella sp.]